MGSVVDPSAVQVNVDELFNPDGAPLTRTHEHVLSGRKFTLHELSAGALWAHTHETGQIRARFVEPPAEEESPEDEARREATNKEVGDTLNRAFTAMLVRFLRGEDHEVIDQDVDTLISKLSSDQIDTLYTAGMTYNGSSQAVQEAIQKN